MGERLNVLICLPILGTPEPTMGGLVEDRCRVCDAPVWVAGHLLRVLEDPEPICVTRCVPWLISWGAMAPPQIHEATEARLLQMGYTPADIQGARERMDALLRLLPIRR